MKAVAVFGMFHLVQVICTVVSVGLVMILKGNEATQMLMGMSGLILGTFLVGPVASFVLACHLGMDVR